MSYDINAIEYISGKLFMTDETRTRLRDDLLLPESCFLDDIEECFSGDELVKPWWSGEGSGRCEDELRAALAQTTGIADLLLTWEGGDSHSGLRVVNGKVTPHEVFFALGKERE